jgi:predicted Zn-dependent peptidase
MNIPKTNKTTLENGLQIITEEIPSMRSVSMGILVGAGSGNESQNVSGISHFIEHMSFKGTAKRSAYGLAQTLDAVGGKMNAYTGKELTMFYAVVLDRHLATATDVLSDMLLNSLFDPRAMEFEKGVVLEEIKMHQDMPEELIHDFFMEKILDGHPLGKQVVGNEKNILALKKEDILQYRNLWYSPKNTIVAFAGALPENIIAKVRPYFEKWQGQRLAQKHLLPEITSGIHLMKKKTEQVHLCLGTKGVSQLDEARYAFGILDTILGGSTSSRLFQEVREKRGLVYSIHSIAAPFRDFGLFYLYAGTSRENLKQVIDLMLEQLRMIKKSGIEPEELARAKEYLKGTLVLSLESTSARMSWSAKSQFYYGRTVTIDEIFKRVDSVTAEEIIKLANQYFRDEWLNLAVIGDMEELPVKEIHC